MKERLKHSKNEKKKREKQRQTERERELDRKTMWFLPPPFFMNRKTDTLYGLFPSSSS